MKRYVPWAPAIAIAVSTFAADAQKVSSDRPADIPSVMTSASSAMSAPANASAPTTRASVKAELEASRPRGALPSAADMDQVGNPMPAPRKIRRARPAVPAVSAASR